MSKSDGKAAPANVTPVMRQFFAAKGAHPDALLFFRMGDFYELFYDDAVVAARTLDLTLTARNKGAEDEIPMAGVPHHAASSYIQRLLEQGFKVALCEQMADPSKVKGIVPREVVRVATPGIAYDDTGLDARENHYLVAVEHDGGAWGIAALDASTGELLACDAASVEEAVAELVRLDAREVLVGPEALAITATLRAALPRAVVREERESPIDAREADAIARRGARGGRGARERARRRRSCGVRRRGAWRWRARASRGARSPSRASRRTSSATRSSSTKRPSVTSSSRAPSTATRAAPSSRRSTRRRRRRALGSCAAASSRRSHTSPRSAAASTGWSSS